MSRWLSTQTAGGATTLLGLLWSLAAPTAVLRHQQPLTLNQHLSSAPSGRGPHVAYSRQCPTPGVPLGGRLLWKPHLSLQNEGFWPLAKVEEIWASHPITHIFKIRLLSAHYASGTTTSTRHAGVGKSRQISVFMEVSPVGEMVSNQICTPTQT